MIRRLISAAALGAVTFSFVVSLVGPAKPAAAAALQEPSDTGEWRAVLERAVEASRASAYEGRLVIVGFGTDGPNLAEVDIAQGVAGGLRVGRAEAWMVARRSDDAFYWQPQAGTLLRLGNVDRPEFSIASLLDKYTVVGTGSVDLRTGPALVLTIREREAEHPRERLYVDDATGLVVRRDTFAGDGEPVRVVAFTELKVTELSIDAPEGVDSTSRGELTEVGSEGLRVLDRTGWSVPEELPAGFAVETGYALPETNGSSLHLVYTDGLYTLSIYQQNGRVDTDALNDAVPHVYEGMHVYRWPGSEPERMVWTGGGRTFTAISDAPLDQVLAAVSGMPHDAPRGLPARFTRGAARVASWVWPFS